MNALPMLPDDLDDALLVGRLWLTSSAMPVVIAVRHGIAHDVTAVCPTTSDLFDRPDCLSLMRDAAVGVPMGPITDILSAAESRDSPRAGAIRLLAPCDLQAIKACGVTFAVSLMERVIEEHAGGDPVKAVELRSTIAELIGADLGAIRPGSPQALLLKAELQTRGIWSQYMEVGIGPDAEVFSKSQPMSAVGAGADIGLHPASRWNNPEPEIVLAVNSRGRAVGATLGNDVNLRDIEGRSALLLGKAKDNNGSCAIGPFIRLFDEKYTIDSIRQATVSLRIVGADDEFVLEDASHMRLISRDPLDLVGQVWGPHHQYPDGFMLFLGTMFSPIEDRDGAGTGFTHHLGDVVTISTPTLGALTNTVRLSTEIAPWTYGVRALYADLWARKSFC